MHIFLLAQALARLLVIGAWNITLHVMTFFRQQRINCTLREIVRRVSDIQLKYYKLLP